MEEPSVKCATKSASGDSDSSTITVAQSSPSEWKKDPTYYQEDGDCFILVGGTLFKIPRILLTRASSVFQGMFKLPKEPGVEAESLSDKNPLILHDSVDDFRALCWALTSFPGTIIAQNDPLKVQIRLLVSVFHIAHKYQFIEFESWAGTLLTRFSSNTVANIVFLQCTIEDLKRVMSVAALSPEHAPLVSNCITQWLKRLRMDPKLPTKDALDFAENLGLRHLQGHVYYEEVKRMPPPFLVGGRVAIHHPRNGFNEAQSLRLYRGFWVLTALWEGFRCPPIKQDAPQDHKTLCLKEWQEMWLRDGGNNILFDPLGTLTAFLQRKGRMTVLQQTLISSNAGGCVCGFKQYANIVYHTFHAGMAEYFLGQLPPATAGT